MEVLEANPLEAVQASVACAGTEGASIALQSTVVTAKKLVGRALESEKAAENAALSLAQRNRLEELRLELEEAYLAFEEALTERGRFLDESPLPERRGLRHLIKRKPAEESTDWNEAIERTIDTLNSGAELLRGLAIGQKPGSAARAIASSTARLLLEHHDAIASGSARFHR